MAWFHFDWYNWCLDRWCVVSTQWSWFDQSFIVFLYLSIMTFIIDFQFLLFRFWSPRWNTFVSAHLLFSIGPPFDPGSIFASFAAAASAAAENNGAAVGQPNLGVFWQRRCHFQHRLLFCSSHKFFWRSAWRADRAFPSLILMVSEDLYFQEYHRRYSGKFQLVIFFNFDYNWSCMWFRQYWNQNWFVTNIYQVGIWWFLLSRPLIFHYRWMCSSWPCWSHRHLRLWASAWLERQIPGPNYVFAPTFESIFSSDNMWWLRWCWTRERQ